MKIKTYSVTCPYMQNGRKNVDGIAMVEEINGTVAATGYSDDRVAVQSILDDYPHAASCGLTLVETEIPYAAARE